MIFDAHFHLPVCLERNLPLYNDEEYAALSCAHSKEEWELQCDFISQYFLSYGLHPQSAIDSTEDSIKKSADFLEKLIQERKVKAIGEAGFDYFTPEYKASSVMQEKMWQIQLEFALFYKLPLVVHCRKANHKLFEYSKEPLEVTQIITNEKIISPKEAFTTSTLQQEAFTRFKFKTKETTYLAQQLYEGVEVNGEAKGLVTYIRTDSTKLSDTFIAKAKDFIISQYGKDYYSGPRSKKDVKLSQDAHEAIRPTDLSFTPELAKQYLSDHLYKLYKLIYERTLASLMSDKVEEVTTVTLKNSHLTFEIKGIKVNFAGYDLFKMDEKEENSIPTFNVGEKYDVINQKVSQHFTKPPS